MEVLLSISNVLFVVLAVLLIIIILLQSDKSAGMGILGGSSQTAFGSSTADVITKITTVMVALFMLGALGLAIMQSYKEKGIAKDFESGTETTQPAGENTDAGKAATGDEKAETPAAEPAK